MKGLTPISGDFGQVDQFDVDASNSTAIYKKGGVIEVADGNVDGWDGTANAAFIGVAKTIYDTNGVELDYLPATTAGKVDVYTDPEMRYSIESATGIAKADRFGTADLASNGGDTTTGESTAQLSATIAADDQFRILGIIRTPGNDWATTNGDTENTQVEVVASLHALNSTPNGLTS